MIRVLYAVLLTMVIATPLQAGGADNLKAGLAAVQNGKGDDAIQQLTLALQSGELSQDDQVTANKTRGGAYFSKSLVADAFDRRDEALRLRDSAVADYTAALRLKPEDAALLAERGQIYSVNGQYDQAVADFDVLQRLKPSPLTLVQRAESYRGKGDYDHAIADYSAALELDAKDTGLEPWAILSERGYADFLAARFDVAATDFEKALTLGAKTHEGDVLWTPYQAAWLHIARARAGQNDAEELARNATKVDLKQWPGTLLAFFLGQLKAEDIEAPTAHGAMGRTRECNMSFFVGQVALIKGDAAAAARSLEQAHAACNIHAITFLAANVELKRMKK
jgi:lipoprotein NlpI